LSFVAVLEGVDVRVVPERQAEREPVKHEQASAHANVRSDVSVGERLVAEIAGNDFRPHHSDTESDGQIPVDDILVEQTELPIARHVPIAMAPWYFSLFSVGTR